MRVKLNDSQKIPVSSPGLGTRQSFFKEIFYPHISHLHQFAARWHGQELLFFIYMDMQEHAIHCVWILFIPTSFSTLGEKKNIWSELESNSGPLVSQATTLTNRSWLLGSSLKRCCQELRLLHITESVNQQRLGCSNKGRPNLKKPDKPCSTL